MLQGIDHIYRVSFHCASFCEHSAMQVVYTALGISCTCRVCCQSESENAALDWFWFERFSHTTDNEMEAHRYEVIHVLSEYRPV